MKNLLDSPFIMLLLTNHDIHLCEEAVHVNGIFRAGSWAKY